MERDTQAAGAAAADGIGVAIDQTQPTVRAGFRLVAQLVRPHWLPFGVAVAGSAAFAAATVLATVVLGWVADEVVIASFEDGDLGITRTLLGGTGAILGAATLAAAGVVIRRYFAGMTSERAERSTRSALADQYLDQPMSWIRSVPTGRLIAHVDADTQVLVDPLHPLPFGLGVIFLALFAAISLLLVDPWIALIAVVLFPVIVIVNSVYSHIVRGPLAQAQARVAEVAGIAHESFEGAMIVKTLGRRAAEVERFDASADRLRDRRQHVAFVRAVMDAMLHALPSLGILTVVIVGAYRIRAGAMTPGDVVQVSALFTALATPMVVFGFLLESLIPSVVAWNRLRPVVEAERPALAPLVGRPGDGALDVRVESLRFAWPEAPDDVVLDDINLQIEPGEMVVIVGPTGSGKSTLCAAVAGILDDAAAHVYVGGRPMVDFHPDDRAAAIAYVFQEAFLFAETIEANFDLNDAHSTESVVMAAKLAAIDQWISSLPDGYKTVVGERGVTVSGGQRQRIALARAIVQGAGLIILDDATSAVDTVVEQEILSHLRSSIDATMLIVANRVSTIALADRVVHLVDGRIAGSGTHAELLADREYHALVTAYAEGADV